MESGAIGLFVLCLALCIALNIHILWALLAGLCIFWGYARLRGFRHSRILGMCLNGVYGIQNILLILALIGCLTAGWRAGGTIPYIIVTTLEWIDPAWFPLWAFLACSALSLILGTAFGTVTTLGVILMILARAAGVHEAVAAGAIMSGIYFGDRISPMSSSALFVATLTTTDIHSNIAAMAKTSTIPFLLTCAAYAGFSLLEHPGIADVQAAELLRGAFNLNPWTALPAGLMLLLACLRVEVKINMLCSILLSILLSLFLQHLPPAELLTILILGFHPEPQLSFLSGGGLQSMVTVLCIMTISSAFAGIFEATGLLAALKARYLQLARHCGRFFAMTLFSLPISAAACNQTLAVFLTAQLSRDAYEKPRAQALHLENSVILLAPLIPWSTASAVPLASLEASSSALIYAFFLYAVPLINLVPEQVRRYSSVRK